MSTILYPQQHSNLHTVGGQSLLINYICSAVSWCYCGEHRFSFLRLYQIPFFYCSYSFSFSPLQNFQEAWPLKLVYNPLGKFKKRIGKEEKEERGRKEALGDLGLMFFSQFPLAPELDAVQGVKLGPFAPFTFSWGLCRGSARCQSPSGLVERPPELTLCNLCMTSGGETKGRKRLQITPAPVPKRRPPSIAC